MTPDKETTKQFKDNKIADYRIGKLSNKEDKNDVV